MEERQSHAERIRSFVRERYLQPARLEGKTELTIRVGDVAKELGLNSRIPAVCNALRSRALQRANAVQIVKRSGPPSGQSPTVTFTYRLNEQGESSSGRNVDAFLKLRGIAKDIYSQFGGGEAYLKAERTSWGE